MHSHLYESILNNPPELIVCSDPREVIFSMVSVMCDNRGTISFKKNSDGDFRVSSGGEALSNFQIKGQNPRIDMEWAADDQDWKSVIGQINTGTSKIVSVRSRS